MAGETQTTPKGALDGGHAASHSPQEDFPLLVGPTTDAQKNTLRFMLIPVACWRINDVRFDFDSSFVLPDAKAEFTELGVLQKAHPGAPLSIFGHADPVGNDDYNKSLSGRRAEAIYAVLIRDPDRWEKISKDEGQGHQWGIRAIQTILAALGEDPGEATGTNNQQTKNALRSFQGKNGLTPSDDANKDTRIKLYSAYMDFLAGSVKLAKTDFLAQGADDKGKGDFQGCSEFNPAMVFSKSEDKDFQKPSKKAERDEANSPNRRVLVLLFRAGSQVPPAKWPCPRASEGVAGCKKRFWSDGDKRRNPQEEHREFSSTKDTFGCRFYHRLTIASPCEGVGPITPQTLYIKLTFVDDHFAPSTESLDIKYTLLGFAGRAVKIRIEAENYDTKVVFERDLTDAEKVDGDQTIQWDGKLTAGARKDRFATPLMGPFTVHLVADNGTDSTLQFKILYHSVTLGFGKHIADETMPPESDQNKFVQAKLDELGYDAGPVNGTIGAVTQNAIRRFQRANYKAGTQALLPVTGNSDADTIAAMKAATAREMFESGKTPLTGDAKFYVYDNFMNDPTMDFVTGNTPEFNSQDRKQFAEDKMERPFLPLEVEVKLLNKANSGVSAPDAVGEAPVSWEMDDATEDSSIIPASNNLAQTYVQHAREIGVTATVAGAARIDTDGDNALDTFEGFRKSAPADYVQSMFPNDAGSALEPYKIDRYDKESRDSKDFHQAIVKAWDDASKFPKRKGRAGLYFRFSMKGGDDGKVRAGLSFQKLPNQKFLEDSHKEAKVTLFAETGRWTVWRRTRFSAYCAMGAPFGRPAPDWGKIRDLFKQAFIEVENNGQPLQILNYSSIITDAVYRATIMAMPSSHRPAGATSANLNYSATAIYGGPALPQQNGETEQQFKDRVRGTATTTGAVEAWCTNPINAILKVVYDQARKTSPEGYVIFDYRMSDPRTAQTWNPALNGGHGGFQPSTSPFATFMCAGRGYVRCAGSVTLNLDNNAEVNDYVAHEGGHARFLYHHAFVDETNHTAASANPTHHDAADLTCTMSYTAPPNDVRTLIKPYCGKCILRLRGWKVTTLPKQYT